MPKFPGSLDKRVILTSTSSLSLPFSPPLLLSAAVILLRHWALTIIYVIEGVEVELWKKMSHIIKIVITEH